MLEYMPTELEWTTETGNFIHKEVVGERANLYE